MSISKATAQVLREASQEERETILKKLETHGLDYFDRLSQRVLWAPASTPQEQLLSTTADQVLFGGAAGGGKTQSLIGYALLRGKNSLLLRRQFPQLRGIQSEIVRVMGGSECYRTSDQTWHFPDGRTLELGSCPHEDDVEKYQGRPRDTLLFDEGAHFSENQVTFLTGWNRSADGRPCRLIIASNPPMSGEGAWMTEWWRPWIDPAHPKPAVPGEIRWFKRDGRQMVEVPEGTEGSISRTFIPSKLQDNPYLANTGYETTLANLPPELSKALLDGDFFAGAADRPLQVIPNSWIRAAQNRWSPETDLPMTHVGIDCSRGGRDRTVIVVRHRTYIAEPIILTREQSATGGLVAARVLEVIGDENPWIRVDAIGVGASVVDHLRPYLGHRVEPVVNSHAAPGPKGQYANRRAYDYWQLRQRLDPASAVLKLPPSPKLYSELSAPEYTLGPRGITVQSKEDLIRKLGRSPDIADAVVLAASPG